MIQDKNTGKQRQHINKPVGCYVSLAKQIGRCRLQPIYAGWLFGAQLILKANRHIIARLQHLPAGLRKSRLITIHWRHQMLAGKDRDRNQRQKRIECGACVKKSQ